MHLLSPSADGGEGLPGRSLESLKWSVA